MAEKTRAKAIPEYKKKIVSDLAEKLKKSRTVLLASAKGLPSSQFQEIKKKLRGKAEIFFPKKSAMIRAIQATEKGALQNLKSNIEADIAVFFSDMDAFELSALLSESESPAKARAGDIAPEDINVEAGPTDLIPGPAISELSSAGLKVMVENGKLAIRQSATVAKAGEKIKENVAGVLNKLGIMPMKVGFEPIVAYDSKADKVYANIRINKKEFYGEMKECIARALSFAVKIEFPSKETISYIIAIASAEEKALNRITEKPTTNDINAKEGK